MGGRKRKLLLPPPHSHLPLITSGLAAWPKDSQARHYRRQWGCKGGDRNSLQLHLAQLSFGCATGPDMIGGGGWGENAYLLQLLPYPLQDISSHSAMALVRARWVGGICGPFKGGNWQSWSSLIIRTMLACRNFCKCLTLNQDPAQHQLRLKMSHNSCCFLPYSKCSNNVFNI